MFGITLINYYNNNNTLDKITFNGIRTTVGINF